MLAIVALCFLTFVTPGIAEETSSTSSRERFTENIREGFSAKADFQIISVEGIPSQSREGSSSFYLESLTYPLHHQPLVYTYKVHDERLDRIKWVTLAWKEDPDISPFVFDLYFHGDPNSGDSPAILVPGLDIRKFLHQSLSPVSDDQDLVSLQAYFSEFSRKAKIVYPASRTGSAEERSLAYDVRLLHALRQGIAQLIDNHDPVDTHDLPPLKRALRELQRSDSPRLETVYRNLQIAIESHGTHADTRGAILQRRAVLERLANTVMNLTTVRRIVSLTITNNCREPGNYEVEVRDALSRPLFRANFNFHYELYSHMLTRFHGFGIGKQGTGFQISSDVRGLAWPRYWDSLLPWNWIKSLPEVSIEGLAPIRATGSEALANSTLIAGEIDVHRRSIPFRQYELEIRHKSEYRHHHGLDPLTYVRVDPALPIPTGFEPPVHVRPMVYWTDSENDGKVVPHHFRTYADVHRYDVFLSEFDLNGVYAGHSDQRTFGKEREEGRWYFNYKYLRNLTGFEFRQWGSGYVELRLTNDVDRADGVNFILGNFTLKVGESIQFLLGIGAQPLITTYNHNVYQDPLLYGLAYDADGTILDHHDQGVGVEKVYVERIASHVYKVRLISHERILPVWEGVIRISQQAM